MARKAKPQIIYLNPTRYNAPSEFANNVVEELLSSATKKE